MPETTQTGDGGNTGGQGGGSASGSQSTTAQQTTQQTQQSSGQQGQAQQGQQNQGQAQQNQSPTAQQGQQTQQGRQGANGQQDPAHIHAANRRIARENAELKRQNELYQNRLRVAMGLDPQRSQRQLPEGVTEQQIEVARQELDLIHPGLGKIVSLLSKEGMLEQFEAFMSNELPAFRDQNDTYWKQLGTNTQRSLKTEAEAQIGKLTDRATRKMFGMFKSLLESDDEFYGRYESGDPDLVRDFITEYKEDYLDPYHTKQTSGAAGNIARNRNLPRGGTGNGAGVAPAGNQAGEEQLDPKDEDSIHKRAFRRFQTRRQAATA